MHFKLNFDELYGCLKFFLEKGFLSEYNQLGEMRTLSLCDIARLNNYYLRRADWLIHKNNSLVIKSNVSPVESDPEKGTFYVLTLPVSEEDTQGFYLSRDHMTLYCGKLWLGTIKDEQPMPSITLSTQWRVFLDSKKGSIDELVIKKPKEVWVIEKPKLASFSFFSDTVLAQLKSIQKDAPCLDVGSMPSKEKWGQLFIRRSM
ncbi:MAG: hypothetical protein A3F46_01225 [Legionellales bacterium RIFCSPHIGHO2_12_FULL_42_9]|nr:MAG: hypothetical protein A3F46_01225 [Legionellales bacterium RIFCSPHIGHO2_12_FULL_42_9]